MKYGSSVQFSSVVSNFSIESALRIRWPKYWSFSFSISPSNDYSRLISFRTDWFDFLAVRGTLKSLLQHPSSKASILWCSAFFMKYGKPFFYPDSITLKKITIFYHLKIDFTQIHTHHKQNQKTTLWGKYLQLLSQRTNLPLTDQELPEVIKEKGPSQ